MCPSNAVRKALHGTCGCSPMKSPWLQLRACCAVEHLILMPPSTILAASHRWAQAYLLTSQHADKAPALRFWSQFIEWKASGIANFAGTLGYIFALALWATSTGFVRRHYWELFYRTHIVGFLGLLIFSAMHFRGAWPSSPELDSLLPVWHGALGDGV